MGLEWGPLSLVSTIEELLERKNKGSGLESREYGRRDPSRWPRDTLYPQKLALTSPTSCCRLVGIVRSRTQATEFSLVLGSGDRVKPFLTSAPVGGERSALRSCRIILGERANGIQSLEGSVSPRAGLDAME
jgi:hypothetical protein